MTRKLPSLKQYSLTPINPGPSPEMFKRSRNQGTDFVEAHETLMVRPSAPSPGLYKDVLTRFGRLMV